MRYRYDSKTVRILRSGEFVGYLTKGSEFSLKGNTIRFHANGVVQDVPLSASAISKLTTSSDVISLKADEWAVEKGPAALVPHFSARKDGKFAVANFSALFVAGCSLVQKTLDAKGVTVGRWTDAQNVNQSSRYLDCEYEGQKFRIYFSMGFNNASVGVAMHLPFAGNWAEFEKSVRPTLLLTMRKVLKAFKHYHSPVYVNKSRVSVYKLKATIYNYVAYLEDAEQP